MARNIHTGYRFGSFEVDLRADSLLRGGEIVRIQQLPFQTLLILLENAGKTVTREEFRQRLWSGSTFIEFDKSLRVAVTKLREALGDAVSEPRYIRTVARKGYQFIGDPTPVFAESAAETPPIEHLEGISAAEALDAKAEPVRGRLRWRIGVLAAAVVGVIFIAALGNYLYARRPLASDKDRVALGGVSNESGDSAFDGVLTTAFRLKLQESPYLSAVHEQDFRHLAGPGDDTASLDAQLSACRALGASFLLNGRLLGASPDYQVELDALRCSDGRKMASEKSGANSQSAVLAALNDAVEKLRQRMGEPESSLKKYNAPLTQATTSSLVALKAFMSGSQKHMQGQEAQSISDYKLAVDLDPQFAMAYAHLGTAYLNTGEYAAASNAYQMAFKLRERTTDRERLYIAAHYYQRVTGELPREIEVYQLWQSVYPRDVIPVENLAETYLSLGMIDKALPLTKLAIELDPGSPGPYALAASAYLGSANYHELDHLCVDPARSRTEMVLFHSACYLSGFAQHDDAAIQRELRWARGNPQESVLLEYVAWTEIYQGQLALARKTFSQARQMAIKQGMTDFAAELDLDEAGLDADFGEKKEAREHALVALNLAPSSRSVQAFTGLVLARAGDVERAQAEAARAAAQAPLDAVQRDTYLALTRASIQLQRHDAKAAIQSMEDARPYDNISYLALLPAYYRGLALLDDHQYAAAEQAFKQVVDHRALYPESVYVVLSELQLGRVLQLSGRAEEANGWYAAVWKTWHEADRDFPPIGMLKKWSPRIPAV